MSKLIDHTNDIRNHKLKNTQNSTVNENALTVKTQVFCIAYKRPIMIVLPITASL